MINADLENYKSETAQNETEQQTTMPPHFKVNAKSNAVFWYLLDGPKSFKK